MPRERPIIMTGHSVRSILAGTKLQTRRVVKWREPQAKLNLAFSGLEAAPYMTDRPDLGWTLYSRGAGACWNARTEPTRCPYGVPGDHLWVRETHALIWPDEYPPEDERSCRVEYRADGDVRRLPGDWPSEMRSDPERPRWRPSIFMKRWMARLTLEITDVRVERLRSISESAAEAEGIVYTRMDPRPDAARQAFETAWDSINGHRPGCAWADDPWVWAITFRRMEAST